MPDRDLLAPAFPDDAGEADAAVVAALSAYAGDPARYAEVLAAVQHSRVLVPVVAVIGKVEVDASGPARDKSSDMAVVLLQGTDGRRALLGFTATTALTAWNTEARPVPVTARTAALAALQEGADALVLDVAGPVSVAVEGEHLRALAAGWTLTRVDGDLAWVRPA